MHESSRHIARQASAEIEVTPEMIEAGLEAMAWYEPYTGDDDECMAAAYRAMESVRRESAHRVYNHIGD